VSGHAKMPPVSHQVSAASLKLLIQQIQPHVRVERDSGVCVARDLYELWGRSPYTHMFVACKSFKTSEELPIQRFPYAQHPWLSHAPTHVPSHDTGAASGANRGKGERPKYVFLIFDLRSF
jgi:hypothetical protein